MADTRAAGSGQSRRWMVVEEAEEQQSDTTQRRGAAAAGASTTQGRVGRSGSTLESARACTAAVAEGPLVDPVRPADQGAVASTYPCFECVRRAAVASAMGGRAAPPPVGPTSVR